MAKHADEPALDDLPSLLGAVPVFGSLEAEDLQQVASIAHLKHHPKEHVLFERGDTGDEFLVVVQGRVKLFVLSEDGRELTLRILRPPQSFGEVSLMDEFARSTSAVALTDVTVLSISKHDFRRLLEGNTRLCIGVITALSRRLRDLTDDTAGLIFHDVYQRLARKLLTLSEEMGRQTDEGVEIPQRLTHQELANLVGATRETVTKALNDMEGRGLLLVRKKQVVILHRAGLEACLSGAFERSGIRHH
ncbi:MAG: Crp/Fnr family transcriptional regulator [Proteobacteria bacterium]|nr:Crp/Fnr family transcriptional regulator [Pseudomonadota bacterium]